MTDALEPMEGFFRLLTLDLRLLAMVFEPHGRILWVSEGLRRLFPASLDPDFEAGMVLPRHLMERLDGMTPDVPEEVTISLGKLQTWHGSLMLSSGRCYLMGVLVTSIDDDVFRKITISMNEVLNLYRELARQKAELELAQKNVKTLRGMLPICSSCKKIRDDRGYWEQVEEYMSQHTDVMFSHGLCPDCMKKLYPDLF